MMKQLKEKKSQRQSILRHPTKSLLLLLQRSNQSLKLNKNLF